MDSINLKCKNIKDKLVSSGVNQLDKLCELLNYLQSEYPHAPGSSCNHQNWSGGYYDHIDDCLNWAIKLYDVINPPCLLSDVVYVIFLHDIEKPIKYCAPEYVMGRSDQSIRARLMDDFGIIPNEEQMNALKYIHGEGIDYRKDKRVMSELAAFCHIVDTLSARIFHSNKNTQ